MKQQKEIDEFASERDWKKYHTPKELLLGLIEEIGEFRNIIKWELDESKIKEKIRRHFPDVEDFFGDMLWELCLLGNYCEVDIEKALNQVIRQNKIRFPVDQFKGKHTNE